MSIRKCRRRSKEDRNEALAGCRKKNAPGKTRAADKAEGIVTNRIEKTTGQGRAVLSCPEILCKDGLYFGKASDRQAFTT